MMPDDSGQEVQDWRKHNSTQKASGEKSEIFTQQRWTALGDDSFVSKFMIIYAIEFWLPNMEAWC